MAFRYPLQKVVDLKSNEKTQSEWLLSAAVQKLDRENRALSELQAEKTRVAELLSISQNKGTSVSRLSDLENYSSYISQQIIAKIQETAAVSSVVSKRKQEVVDKTMQEKVWLNVREKSRIQFAEQQLRDEQLQLDELAISRRHTHPAR